MDNKLPLLCKLICVIFFHALTMPALASQVAGGFLTYKQDSTTTAIPFILKSTTGGLSWDRVAIPKLPSTISHGFIGKIYCAGTTCIAGGGYTSMEHGYLRDDYLLLTSLDAGQSWQRVDGIDTHEYRYENYIMAMTCFEERCIASGSHFYKNSKKTDFIVSQDGGQSWTIENTLGIVPDSALFHYVKHIDCNRDYCIAVGVSSGVRGEKTAIPLLLMSYDGGKNWSLKRNFTGLNNNNYIHISYVRAADSFGNTNIALGETTDYSFILISDDKVWTWKTIDKIANLPVAIQYYSAKEVSCNDSVCIATGHYRLDDNDRIPKPLILLSQDKGLSWEFIKSYGLPNGELKNVYCDKNKCLITGTYYAESNITKPQPAILIGDAKGRDWQWIRQIDKLPNDIIEGISTSLFCDQGVCVISGYFIKDAIQKDKEYPFFLISQDDGKSWTYVNKITGISHRVYSTRILAST